MASPTRTLLQKDRALSVSKEPSRLTDLDGWAVRSYRDETTEEHYLHFTFPCIDGRIGSALVLRSVGTIIGRLANALSDKGAVLPTAKQLRHAMLSSLIEGLRPPTGTLTAATGWHGRSFLLGSERIGSSSELLVLRPTISKQGAWLSCKSGSLDAWQSQVAKRVPASSYASFAIMHALAAPLYKFAGLSEGAIFNFSAPSSVGKTTALKAGASVSGDPNILTDWNATLRGLQERAAAHSSLQLILDDTETIQPHEGNRLQTLLSVTHKLTSGTSTDYAESVQGALRPLLWTCWAISSSPRGIDSTFEAAGRPRSESDQVRLIDIPVPKATEGGIWDRCSEDKLLTSGRSEKLGKACQANYGYPMREWLDYVVDHQDGIGEEIQSRIERFVVKLCPTASGVERRIARKFGLVYAAGRIATDIGLLPWDEKHALNAAGRLFQRAMDALNGGRIQADLLLKRLAEVEASGFPAFTVGRTPTFTTIKSLKGFRLRGLDGEQLCVCRSTLRGLWGADFDTVFLQLKKTGALVPGEGGKSGRQIRVIVAGRMEKKRLLVIDLGRLRDLTGSPK